MLLNADYVYNTMPSVGITHEISRQSKCMALHTLLGFKCVWNVRTGHSSGGGETHGNSGETNIHM